MIKFDIQEAAQDFFFTREESCYLPLLREIHDPPEKLYWRGLRPDAGETYFAIVGTRHPSPYGKEMAYTFASELAGAGIVIVSGLAYGIDAIAHEAALDVGGKTVAVLGSGFNHITPPCNRSLAKKIEKNGCVLTEYPHDVSAHKGSFPRRNRIIAGMSIATLVIEAPYKSGALITARLAFEYNRDVFALPGNITQETSQGTNKIIQQCLAYPVTSVNDILLHMDIHATKKHQQLPLLTSDEICILSLLKKTPSLANALIAETKLPASRVNSALSLLELKRLVRITGSYVTAITR